MDGTLTTRESHGTHPLHMEEGQIRDIVQEIAIEGVVIDNDHGHHGSEVSSTDTSSTSYTESDDESGDEEGWSESEDEQDVVLRTSDRTGIYGFFVRGYYRVLYVCERIGEGLAWGLGITEPRFYDVQLEKDAMQRYQERMEEQERNDMDVQLRDLEENTLEIAEEGTIQIEDETND